jgi:hypothetical protein
VVALPDEPLYRVLMLAADDFEEVRDLRYPFARRDR